MKPFPILLCALGLFAVSCHEGVMGLKVSEGGDQKVLAPTVDRCTRAKDPERKTCEQFKQDAHKYLSGLNVNDNLCIEGGVGDEPGATCKARGQIIDGNNQGFLVKIHDPTPGSHWQGLSDHNVWFDNEALVDQYLADRGFE
jgi:hypothetical protein